MAHFIPKPKKPVNWRKIKINTHDNDRTIKTPPDVKQMLGFDPKKNKGK